MTNSNRQRSLRGPQWIDKPHIPCGAITALIGRPGSGKTKIAFDIARRTAQVTATLAVVLDLGVLFFSSLATQRKW